MSPKLVYSTATGSQKHSNGKRTSSYVQAAGPAKVRLETKGRGGKAVTVLFNLPFDEDKAKELMRHLQAQLGCGATLKASAIEFQGDRRVKIAEYFDTQGWKLIRAGGAT